MEYAVAAWNPYLRKDVDKLERVQRRATKVAHCMRNKTYEERLVAFNLTTLEERRIRGDLIQLFKINRGIEQVNWIREPRLGHPRGG